MTELRKLLEEANKRYNEEFSKLVHGDDENAGYDYYDAKAKKLIYEECNTLLQDETTLLVKVEVLTYYFQFMRVRGEYWLLNTNFE